MQLHLTERFRQSYADAPAAVQHAADKQLQLLLANLRHPSLHAKKYDETNNVWQARVTRDWRLYFTIIADTYFIVGMKQHPK